ncbi:hypothetical protein BJ912DRAFT_467467 [Pholiota molesta]|nr:hypothetical protein BJ912DRAFT_467467 [Pholiota molesta]
MHVMMIWPKFQGPFPLPSLSLAFHLRIHLIYTLLYEFHLSSSLPPAAASSPDQKLAERSHEVHGKLGPSGHTELQEHIASSKSYSRTSTADAMEHNSLSNPSRRVAFPLQTILPLPPSLLHSSLMLSPEEEQTIWETIHDISNTLTSVDDEITRVRATLSTLEEYRSTLQTTLARHQNSLAPIHKLPPEILGEIFLFVFSSATLEWPGSPGRSQMICRGCCAKFAGTGGRWRSPFQDYGQIYVLTSKTP